MSYTLYKEQEDALEKLYKMKSAVIALMPGLGKCKSLYSRIQTSLGYIPLGSILPNPPEGFTDIGDRNIYASTRLGEKKIKRFYYEKRCLVRYILLENGLSINGTLNHRILVRDENNLPVWKCMGDITEHDYVMLSLSKYHSETSANYPSISCDELYNLGNMNIIPDYIHLCSRKQKVYFILGITSHHKGNLLTLNKEDMQDIQYILESVGIYYKICDNGNSIFIEDKSLYEWDADKKDDVYRPVKVLSFSDKIEDVCDVEVEDTHEYLSQGVINHNTLLTLHLAKHLQETEDVKTIFCIPKSARAAYTKELEKKLETDYVMINTDSPLKEDSDINKSPFILIEFPVLGNYIDMLVEYVKTNKAYIFIDEAHALCSPKSAQTSYMKMIRDNCVGCYSISASPLMTSIEGLFYLYSFTFPTLKIFQSWFRFRALYCITKDRTVKMMGRKRVIKEIIGYKNMEELNVLLDKLTIKGSIQYNVEYKFLKTALDANRIESYSLAAKGLLVTEKEKEWGPRLHDLQRVVDGLPQNNCEQTECNKTHLLIQCLKEIMERGEATLIYVEYMDTIEYLKSVLNKHKEELGFRDIMVISGKEKEEKRQQIEQNLQAKDIVIISQAGKQSRNLQRANNLIMYNVPYSLGDFLQCPCKGTKVLTDNGYINVEDLPDTFNILRHNHVYKAEKLGIKKSKVVNIHFTNGFSIKVSENHKFLDTVGNWVEARSLISGKHLALDFSEPQNTSKYPDDFWYLIGYYIGDGYIDNRIRKSGYHSYGLQIVVPESQKDFLDRLKKIILTLGYTPKIRQLSKRLEKYQTLYMISIYSKELIKLLESIGIHKCNQKYRSVPDILYKESRSARVSFLQGYFDADGTKGKGNFRTCSEILAKDIQHLLMSIGIISSIRGPYIYIKDERKFYSYTINMLGDCSLIDKDYINKSWYSNGSVSTELQKVFLHLVHDSERKPENVSRVLTKLKYCRRITPYQESLIRSYYYIPEDLPVNEIYTYYKSNWMNNTRLYYTKYDIKKKNICSKEKLSLLVNQLNLPLDIPNSLEVSSVVSLPEEEDTYLISVDSEEHAYVTEGLISHNCSGRICRVDTTYSQQHFYILEVDRTIDSYRIALFKDHLALLDRLLGKKCRGTLTCDYVEIDRMNINELKKSLLWRMK